MKKLFKVIVAGGRKFTNYNMLCDHCDRMLIEKKETHEIVVISGCADGADTLAIRYAKERGHGLIEMPADWKRYGRKAGPIRNVQMVEVADALIAFWDNKSRGTADVIKRAKKKGVKVHVAVYLQLND